ncbi:MAG: DUF5683 domain-containing protein [Tannerellaceae bacterium]|jgi:hypothetical protein|nr:DUF5683 domain-containing protein [Tannerellaceae bacterium]
MNRPIVKICCLFVLLFDFLCFLTIKGQAQEGGQDSIRFSISANDSISNTIIRKADSTFVELNKTKKTDFKPNSTKALLLSFIPGMGQIYNRKYWKLPIVYGGYMGFLYAITWNSKNYQDYWGAYKSIIHDSQEYSRLLQEANGGDVDYKFSKEWTDFLISTDYKSIVNNTSYHTLFKNRKDFFRRNRDLSIILAVGWFGLCMIDAYVDSELFDFDISPNLTIRVDPVLIPSSNFYSRGIGLNCNITF